MAVLEKKFDKDKWKDLLIQKQRENKIAKDAVKAHEAAKKVAGNPTSSPYSTDWRYDDGTDNPEDFRGKPVFGVEEGGQTFFEFPFVKIRGNNQKVAHHINPNAGEGAGLDGFKEPGSIEDILQDIITNETLSDEEKASTIERITGQDPQEVINQFKLRQQQKQSLKINNPLIAMNPADIPLGDGLIKEALSGAQQANKEKYDLMYQEGWMSREEYIKQMKRTFGKEYEQYLVD